MSTPEPQTPSEGSFKFPGAVTTLVIVTVWQFLQVYDVVATGPQWMGVIWFAMLGLAGPIARWKA